MSEKSIYQKIFDALNIAILAETGVTLNWREAVELRGYIKSLEEAYVLEGNDYRAELARRDEIIKRFEKVVEYIIQEAFETEIILWGTDEGEVIAERYNKIVNRALMKELE